MMARALVSFQGAVKKCALGDEILLEELKKDLSFLEEILLTCVEDVERTHKLLRKVCDTLDAYASGHETVAQAELKALRAELAVAIVYIAMSTSKPATKEVAVPTLSSCELQFAEEQSETGPRQAFLGDEEVAAKAHVPGPVDKGRNLAMVKRDALL
eukprot:1611086-Amphidinium_carterae.1